MPSAFHANEGTTGIRRLYFQEAALGWCLSFENRRRIFDIDSRFKFDLIVAHRPGPTKELRCGFYLDRIEDAADPTKIMTYTMQFLEETGGTPLELRGAADLRIAEALFAQPGRLGTVVCGAAYPIRQRSAYDGGRRLLPARRNRRPDAA